MEAHSKALTMEATSSSSSATAEGEETKVTLVESGKEEVEGVADRRALVRSLHTMFYPFFRL